MVKNNHPDTYYLIFDFETGGLLSQENPAVELAMIAVRGDNFEEIGRIDDIIVPYDKKGETIDYDFDLLVLDVDKKLPLEEQELIKQSNNLLRETFDFVYTKGAMDVHGVDDKDMMLRGIEVKELVEKIINLATAAKASNFNKAVLVGHNVDFDRNFMQQIFNVSGKVAQMQKIFSGSYDYYGNFQPHSLDTLDLAKLKWHKSNGEIAKYNLSSCADKFGIDLVGAHRAMNDVVSTKELLLAFKKSIRSKGENDENEESRFRNSFKFEY